MAGSRSEARATVERVGPPSGTTVGQWVAKAEQESSYSRTVVNSIGCVGYWQICPVNFGWLGVSQNELQANADLQFRSVKRIYARQGWAAWNASGGKPSDMEASLAMAHDASPFSPRDVAGAAQAALEAGADAIPDNPIAQLVMPLGIIAGAIKGIAEFATDPNIWRRIALVIAGGGIVLVGAAAIAGPKLDEVTPAAVKAAATKGLAK